MREFLEAWRARLREMDFEKLGQEGRADYVLLDNHLQHELALLDRESRLRAEGGPLLPFAERLLLLHDARRNLETPNHQTIARTVADVTRQVDSVRALFDAAATRPSSPASGRTDVDTVRAVRAPRASRTVANRVADDLDELRRVMTSWYRYYDGY